MEKLRALNNPKTTPSVTAYRSNNELLQLKRKFYSENKKLKVDALRTVEVLQLRGRIPHGLECTAIFTSTILSDTDSADSFLIRNAYAMAIVRFVNGVLDPFQLGQYASALVNIAKIVDLPLSFVELRHAATHEQMPSLESLRSALEKALLWLYENFWSELPDSREERWTLVKVTPEREIGNQIVIWLKIYKRFRKRNLDVGLERKSLGDSEEVSFWAAVDNLSNSCKSPAETHLVVDALINQDFLVRQSAELKFRTAVKLYMPLLELLGPVLQFQVVLQLMEQCSELSEARYSTKEQEQAEQWISHLVPILLSGKYPVVLPHYTVQTKAEAESILRNHMGLLGTKSSTYKLLDDVINGKDNPAKKKYQLPPLLEELLSDVKSSQSNGDSLQKQAVERPSKKQKPLRIFHERDFWEPVPFGVAIE